MPELTPTQADLVHRLVDAHARLAEITTHMNDLKSRLRAELPPGGYTLQGRPAVTVTPNRRFDPGRAEETLPPELLRLCTVGKVDPGAARKVLPPALYEQCMTEIGDPVVRLA